MNVILNTNPYFIWPLVFLELGFAIGSMIFAFLILHSYLKERMKNASPTKKILGALCRILFGLFAISAVSFLPGLIASLFDKTNIAYTFFIMMMGIGVFSTIYLLYITPSSHFQIAKEEIFKR